MRLANAPFLSRRHSGVHSYPYDPTAKPIQSSHPYGETTTRDCPLSAPFPPSYLVRCRKLKSPRRSSHGARQTPRPRTFEERDGGCLGWAGAYSNTKSRKQCIARARQPGVKYSTQPQPPLSPTTPSPHVRFIYAAKAWRLGRKAKRSFSVGGLVVEIDRTRSETWIRRRGDDRSFQRWGARDGGGAGPTTESLGRPTIGQTAFVPGSATRTQLRTHASATHFLPPSVAFASCHRNIKTNDICFFPLRCFFWELSVWHSLDGNRIVNRVRRGVERASWAHARTFARGGLGDVAMEERNAYDARCARVA